MGVYIKAEQVGSTVIYTEDSGRYFRYLLGTWAWRNHNPGNIHPGDVSKRNNQIGVAGGCAVFPDRETGVRALRDSLKTTFKNYSIDQLVKQYAPPQDGNNIKRYRKFLHDETGVHDDKKIKDFTSGEFEKLWHAIEKMEGSKTGNIVELFQITQTEKNRNGICSYFINGEWLTKQECIYLAKQGRLDVAVCVSRLGHDYIRARVCSSINNNLSKLIVKKPKT